jgi:hypothetical protein
MYCWVGVDLASPTSTESILKLYAESSIAKIYDRMPIFIMAIHNGPTKCNRVEELHSQLKKIPSTPQQCIVNEAGVRPST